MTDILPSNKANSTQIEIVSIQSLTSAPTNALYKLKTHKGQFIQTNVLLFIAHNPCHNLFVNLSTTLHVCICRIWFRLGINLIIAEQAITRETTILGLLLIESAADWEAEPRHQLCNGQTDGHTLMKSGHTKCPAVYFSYFS